MSPPVQAAGPNSGAAAAGGEAAAAAPRVVGVDLSLTSTGVATANSVDTIRSEGHRTDTLQCRHERLRWIRLAVLGWCADADLVVIEGPAYAKNSSGMFDRAGLWWQLTSSLLHRGTPVAVVPPANRAKYATGRGNAPKDLVLTAAVKRLPQLDVSNNNEADAAWLCAMGHDHLGHPLALLPDLHRKALDVIPWPELVTG